MKKNEKKLWEKAKYSLEKHYDYICCNPHSKYKKLRKGFINIGISGIIPDVIGIKHVGGQYEPKIEVIALEIKENVPRYKEKHMDQAKRAFIFAHKVYLVSPREFKPEEIELAVEKRVGLFELNVERQKLKLIVPSPFFSPSEDKVIQLMRKLGWFKCTICGCYWNKELVKGTQYKTYHQFYEKKRAEIKKFICEKCSNKLYEMHLQTNRDRFLEEWKFKRIANKVKKFEKKFKNTTQRIREKFNKRLNKLIKEIRRLRRKLRMV